MLLEWFKTLHMHKKLFVNVQVEIVAYVLFLTIMVRIVFNELMFLYILVSSDVLRHFKYSICFIYTLNGLHRNTSNFQSDSKHFSW